MHKPLRVAEVMSTPTYFIGEMAYLDDVDRALQEHEVSALAVTDSDGELTGVISRTDLIERATNLNRAQDVHTLVLPEVLAREAMTPDPVSVGPDDPLSHAAQLMSELSIHRVFVIHERDLAGVVATRELISAVGRERIASPLRNHMSRNIVTVDADEEMGVAVERIHDLEKHGLVVMRDDIPVGVVTMDDALLAQSWPPRTAVENWMSPGVLCLPATMPLHRAAAHALAWDVRHIVVLDDQGIIGIATGADFSRAYAAHHC